MSHLCLYHLQTAPYVRSENGNIILTLRIDNTLDAQAAYVRVEPDNEEQLLEMSRVKQTERYDFYHTELVRNHAEPATLYCFKVIVGDQQLWLDAAGVSNRAPLRDRQFRYLFEGLPPHWLNGQVFYQIFPDRFCNGNPEISVTSGEYSVPGCGDVIAKRWGEPVDDNYHAKDFFGGDLIGVRQRLDYLQQLGVTAIYLNPIFTSPSSHKYNTVDYYHVDPHFGGDLALAQLCDAVHQREMKIVLDGVFNHTAASHPWFDRYQPDNPHGAYHHPDSVFRNYYHFLSDAPQAYYTSWKGVDGLPVLDLSHPELLDYFFCSDDAVVKYWLKPPYQIDGWRFDVIHMMGEGAGAKNNLAVAGLARAAIKQQQPDALFLGEHFFESSRWLQGGVEDAAMNYYGFATPLRAFFAGVDVHYQPNHIDAQTFDAWLTDARTRIPFANQLVQWNLLDSHDTARFYTLVNDDFALMQQAVLMLMTYPGVPSIYYGDEIGMKGEDDPHCRACFDWDESHWEYALWQWYQQLIHLRLTSTALQYGEFETLYAKGDVFVYVRLDASESVLVALNRGDAPQRVLIAPESLGVTEGHWQCYANSGEADLTSSTLLIGAKSAAVWQGPELAQIE